MKLLSMLVAHLIALGAAAPAVAQRPELVQVAQRVLVSSLDSTFPAVPFEQWLAQVMGRSASTIRWESNDCGEGGDGLAAPTCVEALLDLAPDITAHVSLVVADIDGTPGKPAIWMLYATIGGSITNFKGIPDWVAYVRRHKG